MIRKGSIAPFLSLKLRLELERDIRKQVSEGVALEINEAIVDQVKRPLAPIIDALEDSLQDNFRVSHRRRMRQALANVRRLLDEGAKERELQDALFDSGLLDVSATWSRRSS